MLKKLCLNSDGNDWQTYELKSSLLQKICLNITFMFLVDYRA